MCQVSSCQDLVSCRSVKSADNLKTFAALPSDGKVYIDLSCEYDTFLAIL